MEENIKNPIISVILPVYNGEKYLKESIESILNQTFSDFELLIFNDCSKDNSEIIISGYSDKRIHYIKNEQNLGLIKTLNKGLDSCKGEFIARMDQDDIAFPDRFEKQIKIFENNKEIGVCGTWFTIFGDGREDAVIVHPENNDNIKISLLGFCAIGHPTVMIRKEALGNLHYEDYQAAEDYELWVRLSRKTKIYNIPESLLHYRVHQTNISVLQSNTQEECTKKIIGNQLRYIGIDDSEINIRLCKILFDRNFINQFSTYDLMKVITFAKNIESNNRKKKFYNPELLRNTITSRLSHLFDRTTKDNILLIPFLLINRNDILMKRKIRENIKLVAKIILRK